MVALLRYAMTVSRPATTAVLVIVVLGGLSGTALTFLVGQVVGATAGLASGDSVGRFVTLLAAMLFVFLLNGVLPVLRMTAVVTLEMRIDREVAMRLARPLLAPYRIAHLDDPEVQDAHARSAEEAATPISQGPTFASFILEGLVGIVSAAVMVGVLFEWWLPIPLLVSSALATWYFMWVIDAEDDVWRGRTERQRRATYLFDLGMLGGPKEIRIFGLSRWLTERYLTARRIAMAPIWRERWLGLLRSIVVMLPHVVLFVAALAYAVRGAYDGDLSLASVVAVAPAILGMSMSFDPWLLGQTRRARKSLISMRQLPDVISERHPETGVRQADLSRAPQEAIRFEGVSFRYPGSDQDVLKDLDLEIRANEALALVGINGAGKSTLVKLLAGGYRPTAGRITVDGFDLAELDPESLGGWQRRIAAIVQDFIQFPLPMRDNVALSGPRDPAGVAREAGIVEIAERLPESWDTVLDKAFPGGVDLSGGEWQRIALARALYAVESGAGVLVLDEPAAALDVRSEAALVERYLSLTAGVTSLIISHRFSVVRDAHRICVLGDGRIVESGTHAELLAHNGHYATMFRLQASRYVDVEADDA